MIIWPRIILQYALQLYRESGETSHSYIFVSICIVHIGSVEDILSVMAGDPALRAPG